MCCGVESRRPVATRVEDMLTENSHKHKLGWTSPSDAGAECQGYRSLDPQPLFNRLGDRGRTQIVDEYGVFCSWGFTHFI